MFKKIKRITGVALIASWNLSFLIKSRYNNIYNTIKAVAPFPFPGLGGSKHPLTK